MFIIRPLNTKDFDALLACANEGKGMTSLPKDPEKLKTLLKLSIASFNSKGTPPLGEYYGFILEDSLTGAKAGVSAIKSVAGAHKIFRFYHLESDALAPRVIEETASELCSLFLLPSFRKEGVGKLLSLSRLHFVSAFPERFSSTLMAELRGYLDENKCSPFWEEVGKKVYPLSYNEAAALNAEGDPKAELFFIKTKILLKDLPEKAKACIGKTHTNTIPARMMLEDEGFKWTKNMDIVDLGPQLAAPVSALKVIRETKLYPAANEDLMDGENEVRIVSNNRLDFRAVLSQFKIKDNQVVLPTEAKQALNVKTNDYVRI